MLQTTIRYCSRRTEGLGDGALDALCTHPDLVQRWREAEAAVLADDEQAMRDTCHAVMEWVQARVNRMLRPKDAP